MVPLVMVRLANGAGTAQAMLIEVSGWLVQQL